MKDLYTYHGNVLSFSSGSKGEIVLGDIFDESKPPCLMKCADWELKKYIVDLSWTDDEEKYMHADYCYDDLHRLCLISIPAGDEHNEKMLKEGYNTPYPAKIITTDPKTKELVIFGQADHLETDNPKPMSHEEMGKFSKWLYDNEYKIKQDPFISAKEDGYNKAISDISFRMFYTGHDINDVARLTGISADEATDLRKEYTENKDTIIKDLKLGQGNQR